MLKILTDNILNLDLESGEEVALSVSEEEELEIMSALLEEEENTNQKIASIVKAVITPPVEVKTDNETLEHIAEDMVENIENIDLVSPSDMGEEITDEDLENEEEWEDDDTIVDMNNIENSLNGLLDDMVSDGFLDDLGSIDIGSLEEGVAHEENEETA